MAENRHPSGGPAGPALSLFSGMGGLDLGATVAGFRVAAMLDADERPLSVASRALRARPVHGPIQKLDPQQVLHVAHLSRQSQALLIGGPPCSGFSHAGFWIASKRTGADSQIHRLFDFLKYVKALNPRAFVLENVPGLLFRNYRDFVARFLSGASRLGYSVSTSLLNARDFGVPQARRRVFVIGIRGRHTFKFPEVRPKERVVRTSGWAIASLSPSENPPERDEALRGKYAHLLPMVPPGGNYLCFTARKGYSQPLFRWRQKYWSFLLKLHPDLPSPTIPANRITNNGPFHWENRHLRLREMARLQGFPDSYPIPPEPTFRHHLGNAVPPLLAANVFWQLRIFMGEAAARDIPPALALAQAVSSTPGQISRALSELLAPT